ncbi:O-methylsterigmatocystin oxidoreductase [Mycena indigotica]|uniref:O-methylsterigmatocystin oxidoreductase n=1 Tax=Mycena indigotica TaxID=2126181 RepID=A0A8H6VSY7_9AGAR|nr:O-methylsterigmatocystin oxidoreductase [Mycena indigotica]KAF7292754.1 O-methylsterigmatocystin oxidoreductase [Mycena indigotica]
MQDIFSRTTATALAIPVAAYIVVRFFRPRPPLPPGPRGWPVIGNLLDMPKEDAWVHWISHKETYGPISSLTVLGSTIIIISDMQTTFDLLDKRSNIYSGRPTFTFAGDMIGWDKQLILSQYGERFRAMRLLLKGFVGSKAAIVPFQATQEIETRYFLARLLEKPETLIANIRLTASALSLQMSHGYRIETEKVDPLIDLVETAAKEFYIATYPGRWIVDAMPFLRYLPSWLPGMGWKKTASIYKEHNYAQVTRPHEFVKRQLAEGSARTSFTADVLKRDPDATTEDALMWAATAIYGGGSDPSSAVLGAFFLIMLLHPEAHDKAQAEIDSIVGKDRLPTFSDREHLPYIEALMKELLRWHPVGRLCIPHRALEDDIFNGYFIPKGSIILPHMWQMSRDTKYYTDPEAFRPERFLGANPELDPNVYMFGFGRRACPGQDFANAIVYLTIVMTLSVYNVRKAKREDGTEIEPEVKWGTGTVAHPGPFEYSITPRSPEAVALITSVYDEYPYPPSDGPKLL